MQAQIVGVAPVVRPRLVRLAWTPTTQIIGLCDFDLTFGVGVVCL